MWLGTGWLVCECGVSVGGATLNHRIVRGVALVFLAGTVVVVVVACRDDRGGLEHRRETERELDAWISYYASAACDVASCSIQTYKYTMYYIAYFARVHRTTRVAVIIYQGPRLNCKTASV